MTARSTSRSRACCCCPCGLAPVVTVAAGTRWGDSIPCYASHHMMLVLLCVLKNYQVPGMYLDRQRYTVFWPYTICRPNTKTKINRTSGQTHRLLQQQQQVPDILVQVPPNNTVACCAVRRVVVAPPLGYVFLVI